MNSVAKESAGKNINKLRHAGCIAQRIAGDAAQIVGVGLPCMKDGGSQVAFYIFDFDASAPGNDFQKGVALIAEVGIAMKDYLARFHDRAVAGEALADSEMVQERVNAAYVHGFNPFLTQIPHTSWRCISKMGGCKG